MDQSATKRSIQNVESPAKSPDPKRSTSSVDATNPPQTAEHETSMPPATAQATGSNAELDDILPPLQQVVENLEAKYLLAVREKAAAEKEVSECTEARLDHAAREAAAVSNGEDPSEELMTAGTALTAQLEAAGKRATTAHKNLALVADKLRATKLQVGFLELGVDEAIQVIVERNKQRQSAIEDWETDPSPLEEQLKAAETALRWATDAQKITMREINRTRRRLFRSFENHGKSAREWDNLMDSLRAKTDDTDQEPEKADCTVTRSDHLDERPVRPQQPPRGLDHAANARTNENDPEGITTDDANANKNNPAGVDPHNAHAQEHSQKVESQTENTTELNNQSTPPDINEIFSQLMERHEQELGYQELKHDQAIAKLESKHQRELHDQREEHKGEIRNLKEELAQDIRDLEESNEQHDADMQDSFRSFVHSLQETHKEDRQSLLDRIAELEARLGHPGSYQV
ncbi:hypothetical protein B0T19DRAFT_404261 [Cercophora scortea]|uniref:Uncharacterized protein n=1 Tax=Cercophora scortea TaxID=314031 RepID=A0AAE0I7C7_9PEZI|nr:hypothetical protein B0T19DRAFT_404261 [Cercophora scortea]